MSIRPSVLLLLAFSPALVFAANPPGADAADPARAAVLAVVQRFFDAMAARDPAMCKTTLLAEGALHALNQGPAAPVISHRSLGEFAERLATWKERSLERIWHPTVLIHGRIATVWAPYDFHRNGKFSHTGIDVFTLLRTGDEWKITSLAFTMEPQVPSDHPDGPPRP